MAEDIGKLKKEDLLKRAARLKLKASASMKKDEIIKLIRKAEAAGPAKKRAKSSAAKPAAAGKTVSKSAKPARKKPSASAKKKPVTAAKAAPAAKKAVVKKPAKQTSAKAKAPVRATSAARLESKATSKAAAPVAGKKATAAAPGEKLAGKRKASPEKKAPAVMNKTTVAASKKKTAKAAAPAESKPTVKAEGKAQARKRAPEPAAAVKTTPPRREAPAKAKARSGRDLARSAGAGESAPLSAAAKLEKKRKWDIDLEGKKFFIADEMEDLSAEAGLNELPETYGENRIVALARDPYQLYVYWEATDQAAREALAVLGGGSPREARWIVRVHDITEADEKVIENARGFFDVEVTPYVGSRYIRIENAGGVYIVTLGLMSADESFAGLVSSNIVHVPRAAASESADVEWMVPDDMFARLYGLSGGGLAGASSLGLGASEAMVPMEEISSGAVSSFGASEEMIQKERERGFFFWLDCELVVYGGTEPDATVTIMGEKIQLRPDGTFSLRLALPDGIHDIPAVAESADGVERREISPTVTRTTRTGEELSPEAEALRAGR